MMRPFARQMRRAILATTTISMLTFAPAAFAQEEPGAISEDAGEIIVTARRRDERLVDVPIAVTAISGDTLAKAGALDITDVANMAPNTTLENSRGKIGRASCRERVSISPVAVRLVMRRYMLSLSDHVL